MKQIIVKLKWIPEFYFIMVALLWFYVSINHQDANDSNVINFPAIIVIVIFQIQLFLNDSSLGRILSGLTVLASVYLIVAFSGRFLNMHSFDYSSQLFTLKFGNLVLLNLLMAFLMYRKYKDSPISQSLTEQV